MNETPPKVPVARLLLAWGFVGIPLVWGVFQTLVKAAALFK
ncbi:MAG TPA: hypothetical protein VE981_20745 [Planctomycetota bacterium]|nr:hypothetical protein [Planctomycetota bacterium]